jgi:ribonuclease P protein component
MPEGTFDWRGARLRKHADYQRVYKASRRYSSQSMSYFFREREGDGASIQPRVGLTTGRVLGGAVQRNRIRRRMRAAVRMYLSQLPAHVDVVLHPRRSVLEIEFERLAREVSRIFMSIAATTRKEGERATTGAKA